MRIFMNGLGDIRQAMQIIERICFDEWKPSMHPDQKYCVWISPFDCSANMCRDIHRV